MASSISCAKNKSYKYDVFLSFRGEDTRKTFVDHLYEALDQRGIYTFKDDERLERGKNINDELLQAIEDSRVYIIVFSKNYASSSWCLDELLKIMECIMTKGHTAFPVFYDVEPSEVRKQTGSVAEAFAKHINNNGSEVENWREALKEAANLSGWDLKNTLDGHEAKVIKLIIEKVSLELRPIDMDLDEKLIGMEQRMQDLDLCLEIGRNDVRMIGIKGMGGSGKTTLARAIFDKIANNFEGQSFVENVRENTLRSGLKKLQKQILKDVLKKKDISVSNVHEGSKLIKKMLSGKKVFIVLDDVDHREQLEMLAGDTTWFASGSRILITTRDAQVLEAHRVKWIRDVNLLSDEEAIRLFNRYAFGQDEPTKEFERHSQEVLRYAAGLPLTIKVLGSDLCGKDDNEWADVLERLKTIPLKETLKILELSYENLEDDYQEIFLDVACFLHGWDVDDAIRMLESSGVHAKRGLRVLEQKSLIKISKHIYFSDITTITMHDHLIEMGMNIVCRKHPDDPHKHSRLWVEEDIEQVMADNSSNEATRYINMETTSSIFLESVFLEGLGNIKNLRCLIVNRGIEYEFPDNCVKIDEARRYFPNSLRYLYWYGYPHWCLPKTFEANNLVALEIPNSNIKQLWEGGKVMKKLKFLDLSLSRLRSLDLGLTPKLERLDLAGCLNLVKLYVHGGCLKRLVYLDLEGCGSLKSLSFIEELESLEVLNIGDLNLREVPDSIITRHSNNSLLELHLSFNKDLEEIPSSIGNLHKLVSLHLTRCWGLKSFPGSIFSLQRLTSLKLYDTGIGELPEDLGRMECLEYLDLGKTGVTHLPDSICMLKRLKTLILKGCEFLERLPEDVGQLESLEKLELEDCSNLREIPRSICNLECLQLLSIKGAGIIHLPHRISLLKGLKIIKSEGQILDDDFIQFCFKYESAKRQTQGFQQLERINIIDTDVRRLPDSICMLKCLKRLTLQRCVFLEKLPDNVGQLESLEVLDLSRCYSIRELPNNICMLKQLKFLVLHHCFCLEKLPDDVGQLESLEALYLNCCYNIREIPSSICMLKHLITLNLEGCRRLQMLPDGLGDLETLQYLRIMDTGIYHLPKSISLLNVLKNSGLILHKKRYQSIESDDEMTVPVSDDEDDCLISKTKKKRKGCNEVNVDGTVSNLLAGNKEDDDQDADNNKSSGVDSDQSDEKKVKKKRRKVSKTQEIDVEKERT